MEFQQLKQEITRIGNTTSYNGVNLLNASQTLTFQVGFANTTNNQIAVSLTGNMIASGGDSFLSLSGDVGSAAAAASRLAKIDSALSRLNGYRSKLGSVQNRLERAISNLEADIENATASNSRIRDVDFAEETSKMTRLQILVQSGTAVLTQANASPQAALSLLG